MKTKEIKNKADIIAKPSDFKRGTFLRKLIDACIDHGKGYYTFKNESGQKVFVSN